MFRSCASVHIHVSITSFQRLQRHLPDFKKIIDLESKCSKAHAMALAAGQTTVGKKRCLEEESGMLAECGRLERGERSD